MLFVLYLQVDSSEERARGSRSIDVTCIAVHALVDVALEMVEQVLYASVDFQGIVLVERNIIAEFDVPLEEDWCLNLFIFWYIARKVLHEHTASDLAGNPGQANYAATKAALQGLTRTLAKELGPKNVRVNAVAPGFIKTDMMMAVPPQNLERSLREHPFGRMGEPAELAAVVTFLCTEDASWVTGQTIVASGRAQIT